MIQRDLISFAAGTTDISPAIPVPLAGYSGRTGLAAPIPGQLEANAVVLRDSRGTTMLLVSLDTLFVGRRLTEAVERWLLEYYAIPSRNVLLVASHTHFAASLDPDKPLLGTTDERYVTAVTDRVQALLAGLLAATRLCGAVATGRRHAPHNVNRRRPWPLPHRTGVGFRFGPVNVSHPCGPCDATLTVTRLLDASGSPRAILVHYACHPVSYPQSSQLSADYVGVLRNALRREHGDLIPVIFLQGFAGNIRPLPPPSRLRPHVPLWRRFYYLVRVLDSGPHDPPHTPQSWKLWAGALAADALCAADEGIAVPLCGSLRVAQTWVALETIVEKADRSRGVDFRRFVVGDALDIVAMSAEPVMELKSLIPFAGALAVGYSGDVFGYWPTDMQLDEGGYEVVGFQRAFAVPGPFRRGLDATFIRAMAALAIPQ